jgi:uncharacterized protein (TIGR03437 family)
MRVCVWVFLVFTSVAGAAISGVSVSGSTNVQSLLDYQAPDDSPCTVQVSERADFKSLVNDVNPDLFPGADSDSRQGNITDGARRVFVIGKRAVEQGAGGVWYSRALQTDTTHYYRIRCGSETASGSFRTANIPVGVTWPWPIPQDPKTGNFRWPSVTGNDRQQTMIDPNYGTLIKRVSVPGDAPVPLDSLRKPFAAARGLNWSNAAAALSNDDAAASYSGGGQDWLVLTDSAQSALGEFYAFAAGVDSITVRIRGAASGDTPEERSVDVCLTLDGASCASGIRSVALDSAASVKTLGGGPPLDTWGIDGLRATDLVRNKNFGVMIRRGGSGAADLSIRYVETDIAYSEMMEMPEGGFVQVCSGVKSNGGYRCAFRSTFGTSHLFWIRPETGEVRWLGRIIAENWGGDRTLCGSAFALFDARDPDTYYCQANLSGKVVLLKGTYTGNDAAQPAGASAPFRWVNLTPPGNTIPDLIRRFDPAFDPEVYPPTLAYLADHYAVYRAWRQGQDSIARFAVFDLGNGQPLDAGGTGRIIASAAPFSSPNTRWCGTHAVEFVGHTNWIGWDANTLLSGGTVATGPYQVTLNTPLPARTGTFAVQVSGEPDPYLMDTAPGDVFQIQGGSGYDFLRIVEKRSATQWVVERTVTATTPEAREAGARMWAFCNARQLSLPRQGAYVYWNFTADPSARDSTNTNWVVEKTLTGGHIVQRGNYRIMEASDGYSVVTPGLPRSFNRPRSYRVVGNPQWAGAQASNMGDGLGLAYMQHESYETYDAGPGRDNWYVDMIPFVGGINLTPSISPVAGFSRVYKAKTWGLHRDTLPTFAHCGGRQLKDISPGPIGDNDSYAYCYGKDCASGASDTDVFVNCPPPVNASSACNQRAAGDEAAVCVADMSPYGQTITQFFLDPSGLRNRALSNALYAWHSPRTPGYFDTAFALPDASWIVFASWANNGRKDLYMLKVPPQPEFHPDARAGSAPILKVVPLSPPDGALQVQVGYGSSAAGGGNVTQNCSGNCTVTLPVRPLELLFTKATFKDSSGQTIGQPRMEAQIGSGIAGDGIAKPEVSSQAPLVNAFSFEPGVAPGAMVTIFGRNLADCEAGADAFPLPEALCNASVKLNGQSAPLFYAGSVQINALLPGSLAPGNDVDMVVSRSGRDSDSVRIPGANVGEVAPALPSYTLDGRTFRAAVQNPDGTVSGPNRPDLNMRPLRLGENGTIWANALGATTPRVPDGQPAPADPPALTDSTVEVYVNDVRQPVSFSGLAPGFSGLYQVNFTLDRSTPVKAGDDNMIWIRVKETESPRLSIAIAGD